MMKAGPCQTPKLAKSKPRNFSWKSFLVTIGIACSNGFHQPWKDIYKHQQIFIVKNSRPDFMQSQLHSCASGPFPWSKSMGLPSHFGIFLSTRVTSKSGVINQAFLIWHIIPTSEKFKSPPGPNAAARERSTTSCLSSTTLLQVSHLCFLLSILPQGAFLHLGVAHKLSSCREFKTWRGPIDSRAIFQVINSAANPLTSKESLSRCLLQWTMVTFLGKQIACNRYHSQGCQLLWLHSGLQKRKPSEKFGLKKISSLSMGYIFLSEGK